ncbi:MAG: hemerythrin domain-containing protein [Candidatus Aenigmarchaeota archaeon]|nr:hemerythrin domain-containing protein [Candidatus Aenigmarchaeota archaeon]
MAFVFEQESRLIVTLKKQHSNILLYLNNFNPLLSGKPFSEATCIVTLRELRKILVEHLSLEDKELYPALEQSKVKEIRETGRKLSEKMQAISQKAFDFFNKYSSMKTSDMTSARFRKELSDLKELIVKRVKLEEEILYPLYRKNPLMTEKEKRKFS